METKKQRKRPLKIGVPFQKYRTMMRREEQLMKLKSYLRQAWFIAKRMEKATASLKTR